MQILRLFAYNFSPKKKIDKSQFFVLVLKNVLKPIKISQMKVFCTRVKYIKIEAKIEFFLPKTNFVDPTLFVPCGLSVLVYRLI